MRHAVLSVLFLVACGGGGGSNKPDAAIDAAPMIDAPAALTGVGQRCNASMPCGATAPNCLARQGDTVGFCSMDCVVNGSVTSDAMGNLPFANFTPAVNTAGCTAAYTGGAGAVGQCGAILAITPADNPLQPNKAYTGVRLGCVADCSQAGTCPSGLTCTVIGGTAPNQTKWCIPS